MQAIRGIDFEYMVASRFSMGEEARILSGLPRRYARHWLANVAHSDAVFTSNEVTAALDRSGVDEGFVAWLCRKVAGHSPTEGLRHELEGTAGTASELKPIEHQEGMQ